MSSSFTTTNFDEQFGRKLWDDLRENKEFRAQGMFWLLENDWRLVIASPTVDKIGQRDAYRKLAEVSPSAASQLSRVELISPHSPMYKTFQTAFAQTPIERIEGRRLTASQVGGMYVPDVYFYGVR